MAMGGLMKVHHHGHGNGNRGKPYGLMILLAFVAAILGVLALHKVRERRVFNLLVKEKDTELASLHFLLQKERGHAREAKWKLEEMKTKANTLRSQKRGLDSRILEMQSIISSLREEQRTIELALVNKQNEIKMMMERNTEATNDNPRVETPVKVWSVSTDDPSSPSINLQTATSAGLKEPTKNGSERDAAEQLAEIRNEQYATPGEDAKRDIEGSVDSRGRMTEQTENVVDPNGIGNGNLEEGRKNSINESQTGKASDIQEEKNSQIQVVEDHDNEGYSKENAAPRTTVVDGLQGGGNSNSKGAENRESGRSYKAGAKLEMSNHPKIGRNRVAVEGYLRKTKRKQLSKIHKAKKNTDNSIRNGAEATSDMSFTEGTLESVMDKEGYQGTIHRNGNHYKSFSVENGSGSEDHGSEIVDKEQESREQGEQQKYLDMKNVETKMQESKDISQGIDLIRLDEDAQELSKDKNTTTREKTEKGERVNDTSKGTELHISLMDMATNTTLNDEDEMLSKAKQQNSFETENQATSIQQPEERIDDHHKDEVSEQTDAVKNDEELDKPEIDDATQTESETDASGESALHSEAGGKSYNQRTEEPEF